MNRRKIDLTQPVLKEIVKIEKGKTAIFLSWFILAIFSLLGLASVILFVAFEMISDQGTLDLLQLFGEDKEVISEFWKDTLQTFWEELPKTNLVVGLLAVVTLVILIFALRKKIAIIIKKIKILVKYE